MPGAVAVRPANGDDLAALADLERSASSRPWPAETVRVYLAAARAASSSDDAIIMRLDLASPQQAA